LSQRLKNYFNLSYLEREIKNNNSLIYRALLKYGYSNFSLDILEYCDLDVLISREQYYLDNLKPCYNILKYAGSLKGFKHSKKTIKQMRTIKLGKTRSDDIKLKISIASVKAHGLKVTNITTGDTKVFTSIRSTAKFIGMHYSYLAKCLKVKKIFLGKGYSVVSNK
jgi:hypothetical protein